MTVGEAVAARHSVRAFKPDPVPANVLRDLIEAAHRAPSGGNLQPWRVHAVAGEPLARIKREARAALAAGADQAEHAVYPTNLWEPYRTRRFENGEDLYGAIALARENKIGRLMQLAQNAELFGAPVALFVTIDRRMGQAQWADAGMFLQTLMLLATEAGLGTCAQAFWARLSGVVRDAIGFPDDQMLFAGVALGHSDEAHPINAWRSRRDPFESYAAMTGFDDEARARSA